MIKECEIVLHNSAVTVVNFNGTLIQFPAIKTKESAICVECIDGRYSIVSKEDYKKSLKTNIEKKSKKTKTANIDLADEVVKSEAVENGAEKTSE